MIKKVLIYPTLSLLILLIAGTVYLNTGDPAKNHPDIAVQNMRIRAPMPGQDVAVGWFDVINKGGVDELLGATSPISDNIELHSHVMKDNVMKMRKMNTVRIDGFATTSFKPGGLHLMIFNTDIPQGVTSVPVTLEFAQSGKLSYDAKIVAKTMDGAQHDTMKHDTMKHED